MSVCDILASSSINVLVLQETWLKSTESVSLHRAAPSGYTVIEEARPSITKYAHLSEKQIDHGGVAIIYRAEFNSMKLSSLPQLKSFEFVCSRLNASHIEDVVVDSIYHLGSPAVTLDFFDYLTQFLEELTTYHCPIMLLDDFNIHVERPDDIHVNKLLELLTSFDMKLHVHMSTRHQGEFLYLFITHSDLTIDDITVSEVRLSDHCVVTVELRFICKTA